MSHLLRPSSNQLKLSMTRNNANLKMAVRRVFYGYCQPSNVMIKHCYPLDPVWAKSALCHTFDINEYMLHWTLLWNDGIAKIVVPSIIGRTKDGAPGSCPPYGFQPNSIILTYKIAMKRRPSYRAKSRLCHAFDIMLHTCYIEHYCEIDGIRKNNTSRMLFMTFPRCLTRLVVSCKLTNCNYLSLVISGNQCSMTNRYDVTRHSLFTSTFSSDGGRWFWTFLHVMSIILLDVNLVTFKTQTRIMLNSVESWWALP